MKAFEQYWAAFIEKQNRAQTSQFFGADIDILILILKGGHPITPLHTCRLYRSASSSQAHDGGLSHHWDE